MIYSDIHLLQEPLKVESSEYKEAPFMGIYGEQLT